MSLFHHYLRIKDKMPSIEHLFGAHQIAGNRSKSAVVWVPSEDEIGGIQPRAGQGNPKVVLNRAAGADLYIFGVAKQNTGDKEENHLATEELLHEVLVALHDEFEGNLAFDRVRWGLRQQDQWLTFGGACILPVYFSVPVCKKPLREATVKGFEHEIA